MSKKTNGLINAIAGAITIIIGAILNNKLGATATPYIAGIGIINEAIAQILNLFTKN